MTDLFKQIFLNDTPLLDVRAPVEFKKGAFPNAINIPLLDDEQRHQIGLKYKEAGQQSAIALGEKLFGAPERSERISLWNAFANDSPGTFLYCFRGGLRSKTTQRWLAESGLDLPIVPGGYKALRQYLLQTVDSLCPKLNFILLGGRTGSGKTLLLPHLNNYIDLEGLANHRGSSFGATTRAQPGNIDFENTIAIALLKFDAKPPAAIFLEDEGRMIGSACIPEALRNRMAQSPIVLLEEPVETRVHVSRQAYIDELIEAYTRLHGEGKGMTTFANHHRQALGKITRRFGEERSNKALQLFEQALAAYQQCSRTTVFDSYVELLLVEYYDPMYDYQLKKKMDRVVFAGDAAEVTQWYKDQTSASAPVASV